MDKPYCFENFRFRSWFKLLTGKSAAVFFNLRVLIGFALCSTGMLISLAGLSKSVTGTVVTTPDSITWYVNGIHGSDSNNCQSPRTACRTIGHAISLAGSGDSIKVAAATYTENLTVGVNLKITGASASTTIIDGGGLNTVVTIQSGVQVSLSKFTIQNGHASQSGSGGGIVNFGTLTMNFSVVSGNTADSSGGGIDNVGTLTIDNSTVSGNNASGSSGSGGGIINGGTLIINDSTISGNTASSTDGLASGGGIESNGFLSINNGTVAENAVNGTQGQEGGNIYISTGSTATLQNSIIANSISGGNCSGAVSSNGYNLSSDGTCGFNNTGDLNHSDPLLGPLQNNGGPTETMALSSGSPAIDAGNPLGCIDGQGRRFSIDQRGLPRPDREDTSGCDMGAYESQSD
jgi:hypothetical protein